MPGRKMALDHAIWYSLYPPLFQPSGHGFHFQKRDILPIDESSACTINHLVGHFNPDHYPNHFSNQGSQKNLMQLVRSVQSCQTSKTPSLRAQLHSQSSNRRHHGSSSRPSHHPFRTTLHFRKSPARLRRRRARF